MQMTGEQAIAAPKQKVWAALNDPAVLAQCIPGCQSLDRDGENRFVAVAEVKIGPIGARFKGNVELSDIVAPDSYTIAGTGNGGIAGNAKGSAKVRLADAPGGGTIVHYTVEADVGGRMAQLGGPIIDATAKNLAGKFFAKFGEVVAGGGAAAALATTGAAPGTPTTASALPAPAGSMPWGWIAALVAAILSGYWFGLNDEALGTIAVVAVLLIVVAAAAFEAGRRGGRR